MALGTAEGKHLIAAVLLELFERIRSPSPRRDGFSQLLLVESLAPPGDVRVVDAVRHTEISEVREEATLDRFRHATAIDEVLAAQREQVSTVRSLWRGC